jgi:hypothetical protein
VAAFAALGEKLRAVFLWHERWFKSDDFNGLPVSSTPPPKKA